MIGQDVNEESFVNRVAQSGLITLDLKDFLPTQPILSFDLAPHLFMGMVLKEKDYREALKTTHWLPYTDKPVAIFCSVDAVIPIWAYMLAATYLQLVNARVFFGTPQDAKKQYLQDTINTLNLHNYADQRVIIKGCADDDIQASAYVAITAKLLPVVKSLMYGEACSNVPLYKQKLATAKTLDNNNTQS